MSKDKKNEGKENPRRIERVIRMAETKPRISKKKAEEEAALD